MKLYEFLECFDISTEVNITDEQEGKIYCGEIGDITWGILNGRYVSNAKINNNRILIAVCEKEEEEDEE